MASKSAHCGATVRNVGRSGRGESARIERHQRRHGCGAIVCAHWYGTYCAACGRAV